MPHLENMDVVLLANNPKCLDHIRGSSDTMFDAAFNAVWGLKPKSIFVVSNYIPISAFNFWTLIPGGKTAFESLVNGLKSCETDYILVCATDLPHISTSSLEGFILNSVSELRFDRPLNNLRERQIDIFVSLATIEACAELGEHKLGLPVDGRPIKNGSVFIIRRDAICQIEDLAQELLAIRRNKFKFALKVAGPGALLRLLASFLIKRLSFGLYEIEQLLKNRLGVVVKGIYCHPALVVDHDKKDDPT